MRFADMSLPPTFQRALATRGYEESTPVQEAIVIGAHGDRDLLVSSKTGSGKTVAFGLSVLPSLLNDAGVSKTPPGAPKVLVIAPTRELAQQVARELAWLSAEAKLRVVVCVGGVDPRSESRQLFAGCHVVVGTPGRLVDHLTRGALDPSQVAAVVLDEADEMLDMGFREELEAILDKLPGTRRTLMFSATLPKETVALASRYTKDPARITAAQNMGGHEDIEHVVHLIDYSDRDRAVVNVLRQYEANSTIVFCQTRDGVARLSAALLERGFSAVAFSGELSQPERQRALQSVRDGRTRVLVCTDVAARGLDLPQVGLVIHADPPGDPAVLQHRSGRTGRAGKKGTAVVLVPLQRARQAERLFFAARIKVKPTPAPTPDQIKKADDARILERITATINALQPEDLVGTEALLAAHTPEQLAALVLLAERRQLPAPEPLDATERGGKRAPRTATPMRRDDDAGPGPADGGAMVWFHINVGRFQRADPKWLLPLLCRRGDVQKRDIGRIVILESETRFEILRERAEHFDRAAARPDADDPRVFIRPFDPHRAERDERPARPQRPRFEGPGPGPRRGPPPRRDDADSPPHGDGSAPPKKRKFKPKGG
jgi:ATP-dependent RNA helicase DeaD